MIIGAAVEAAHAVGLPGPAGEHHDGQLGIDARGQAVGGADAIEQLEPVGPAKGEIEQDQARLPHLDRPHALRRTGGPGDPEPIGHEVVGQEGRGGLVVLDHQDQLLLVHLLRSTERAELAPGPVRCPPAGTR